MRTQETAYDLAIIGGGIAGAAIARDAAMRGITAILFEKNTFGSGTSCKSSKLIHGGIRYLEVSWNAFMRFRLRECWENFRFVLASLRESVILKKIAPDLVHPIELVIPIYQEPGICLLTIYLGSLVYGLLGLALGNRKLPRLLIGPRALLSRLPGLHPKGLLGGIVIWDHWTLDRELVQAVMKSAEGHGARTIEHTRVLTYRYDNDRALFRLHVRQDGKEKTYTARCLVNATGPWVDMTRKEASEQEPDLILPVAGTHIVLKKFLPTSVILRAQDGRIFFVIGAGAEALVGTTERLHHDPDRCEPREEEIEYLLTALERYFPEHAFTRHDVLDSMAGIRPLARPQDSTSPHEASREHSLRIGPGGVLHVLGVKLTDHRRAAKDVVDRLIPKLRPWNPGIKKKCVTHKHLIA